MPGSRGEEEEEEEEEDVRQEPLGSGALLRGGCGGGSHQVPPEVAPARHVHAGPEPRADSGPDLSQQRQKKIRKPPRWMGTTVEEEKEEATKGWRSFLSGALRYLAMEGFPLRLGSCGRAGLLGLCGLLLVFRPGLEAPQDEESSERGGEED